MLSFLIPTYNQVCTSLARELSRQIATSGVTGEVIVMDDGSTDVSSIDKNMTINEFDYCVFIRNEKNEGRSCVRNSLAKAAHYTTLVFLDADVYPTDENFVERYANSIGKSEVVCGGIKYRTGTDKCVNPLRLSFGLRAEVSNANKRSKNPYHAFSSANFMVTKRVMTLFPFDESITHYGHEDSLLGITFEKNNVSILHIDNAIFHDDPDDQKQFLNKSKTAIKTLIQIGDKIGHQSKLKNTYQKLHKLHLDILPSLFYCLFGKLMEKHLLSKHPTYLVFSIYKLSYFCYLIRN